MPVILLAPKETAPRLRSATGDDVVAVLPLPLDEAALKTALTSAVSAAAPAEVAEDMRENVKLLRRVLVTAGELPAATRYPAHLLAEASARLLQGYPDEIRILALAVIENVPQADLRDKVYEPFIAADQPATVRQKAGAAFLRCLVLKPALEKDQLAALRKLAKDEDATLASQSRHALAIATVPQEDRQTHLIETTD